MGRLMPVVCCVWIQVPPARMAQALYSVDFIPEEREALHHQFVSFRSHPTDLLDFAEFLADPALVLSKDDLVDDETVCCLNSLPQAAATQYVAQLVTVLGKQFKIGAAFAEAFFPSSIPSASASHPTSTPRRKKFAILFPHTRRVKAFAIATRRAGASRVSKWPFEPVVSAAVGCFPWRFGRASRRRCSAVAASTGRLVSFFHAGFICRGVTTCHAYLLPVACQGRDDLAADVFAARAGGVFRSEELCTAVDCAPRRDPYSRGA